MIDDVCNNYRNSFVQSSIFAFKKLKKSDSFLQVIRNCFFNIISIRINVLIHNFCSRISRRRFSILRLNCGFPTNITPSFSYLNLFL